MKRFWLLALLMAGSLVMALVSPTFAKEKMSGEDAQDAREDMNSSLGSLSNRITDVEKKQGLQVEVHGFAEQDVIGDDTESFQEVIGNGGVKLPGTVAGDNGFTQMSERNSRLSFLAKSTVDGWATKGYVEADFFGYDPSAGYGPGLSATSLNPVTLSGTGQVATPPNEYKFWTQPTFRLRHAYLDAQKDGWEVLAGQYWTLFGWAGDYYLATVDVQPVCGFIYERVPQIKVMKTINITNDAQVQIAADAEKPVQIISEMPNINGGVRFLLNNWKSRFTYATGNPGLRPLSLGISESNRQFVWNDDTYVDANGNLLFNTGNLSYNRNMWGSAVAIDAFIPVKNLEEGKDDFSAALTGEWTYGAGDNDAMNGGGFGGLQGIAAPSGAGIGGTQLDPGFAGVDSTGTIRLIQLQTIAAQVQVALPPSIGTFVTAGYGEIFSPNIAGLTTTGSKLASIFNDDSCMYLNVMQDFTSNIRVGLEYARIDTHYEYTTASTASPSIDAVDHRIQLSSWYRF